MTNRPLSLVLAAFALVAAGCPHRGFDPSSKPGVPTSGNPAARARFKDAQALFENDQYEQAASKFDQIKKEYPDDPIAPQAGLYAGMAALKQGDFAAAIAQLEPLVEDEHAGDDVKKRARFYLGLAYAAAGKHGAARDLLQPFDGSLAEGDAEQVDLDAALASAYDGLGDAPTALRHYDRFFAKATLAERAHIALRVSALVDSLGDDAAQTAYGKADKRGPSAAFLGRRVMLRLCAAGDAERARRVGDETAEARKLVGLSEAAGCDAMGGGSISDAADPSLVGVIAPLSGKRRLVGEALLRGVSVAAGTFDKIASAGVASDGAPRPFLVAVRDGGESPEQAGKGVDELIAGGAIALLGPADKDASKLAAERAEAAGVPMISLDVGEGALTGGSPHVFRVILPVEARARALARAGYAAGARDFAILAPDMAYGTRASKAFVDEVEKLGGHVVLQTGYAKDATSFVDPVKKLAKTPFDALFVPDTAARLELIAPQLAVANLVVAAPGAKKAKKGSRNIILLATAEALAPSFLTGSGRYTVGALLAPGFYPDAQDARIGPFVQKFRAAYGVDPSYLDAYGYDAAMCVRAVVEGGASTRAAVAQALGRATVPGVTGDIRFDDDRQRADGGVLFTVVSDEAAGGQAIRAKR